MASIDFITQSAAENVAAPDLDDSQRAVVALADAASAMVIGAPGTGKTTTLVEVVADRLHERGWSAQQLLVLTTARSTATKLRDRIALRINVATNGPIARTVNSVAFDIVGAAARAVGAESPRLLTGTDQDSDISQLLAGQIEDGSGPQWPEQLGADVRALRGFRTELRELMMRATEYGVTPARLRELGLHNERAEWVAAADFIRSYLDVVSSARTDQLDSAELVEFAVAALHENRHPSNETDALIGPLRLVLVDDIQEFTKSGMSLLRALAARGIAVIAFGDPDVAANAFRGGEPNTLGRLSDVLGIDALSTLFLSTAHRHGATLRQFTATISQRIGTAGVVGHRQAAAGPADHADAVVRIEADSPAHEWAAIARQLREHHLLHGIGWDQMAVIVRSGAQVPTLARALALAGVPTRTALAARPLRDDHAARGLLAVIDVGSGRIALSAQAAADVLLGPFGGFDALMLRRLRLALRAEEIAGGGERTSDELLVEALTTPGALATIDDRVGRNAGRLAQTLAQLAVRAAAGDTIEELLWLAWERSALAGVWREQALGAGIVASEANRNLDGVVALFTAAKRFVERDPSAGARVFLDSVLDAEVPEDSLSPQAAADTVIVTTPPGVVGGEYDVVAIAGVQEGVWPNLRLRGSLLYPQQLVHVVSGLDTTQLDGRKAVLGDELRMFALAVSRARRQVIVAAVSNDDAAPSVFFALLPLAAQTLPIGRPALSLRAMTGRLRRELTSARAAADRELAASALARLKAERVPGADPASWHGLGDPSTVQPLYSDDDTVPVSPSKLQAFEDSALDWFIDAVSGTQASTAMGLGTIVHWAMETATDPSVETVWGSIESRWGELAFESSWLGEQQKRAARVLAAGVAEYLADFERDGKRLVAAEQRFQLEIGRARVNGSIDRIERSDDGAVVIVDLKTGSAITKKSDIDEHPQLAAYQLAHADGMLDALLVEFGEHHAGGAKLLFVKKGIAKKLYREAVQTPLSTEELQQFRERVVLAAEGMAQAQFDGARELDDYGIDTRRRALHRVRAVSSD